MDDSLKPRVLTVETSTIARAEREGCKGGGCYVARKPLAETFHSVAQLVVRYVLEMWTKNKQETRGDYIRPILRSMHGHPNKSIRRALTPTTNQTSLYPNEIQPWVLTRPILRVHSFPPWHAVVRFPMSKHAYLPNEVLAEIFLQKSHSHVAPYLRRLKKWPIVVLVKELGVVGRQFTSSEGGAYLTQM